MVILTLTDEQYDLLIEELGDGESGRWNSDHYHADQCPSKIKPILEYQKENQEDQLGK